MTQEQETAMYDQPEPLPVPEPALEAALLEDAKTTEPDQPRQVLRDSIEQILATAQYSGVGADTTDVLAAVDRYVDSLPQAQVEYATEAVNPDWKAAQQAEQDAWVRRTALEQAVELVKAGVSPGMVETAAEAANKFHTFLTGSND